MKRFQYSLERVLQLRRQAEQDKVRALGEMQQKINVQQAQMKQFQAEFDAEDQKLRSMEAGGILDIDRVKAGRSYQLGLQLKMARTGEQLKILELQREARRKAYIEARKKKRVLELFKDRKFEMWRQESEREQRMEADDFATMGYRRHEKG